VFCNTRTCTPIYRTNCPLTVAAHLSRMVRHSLQNTEHVKFLNWSNSNARTWVCSFHEASRGLSGRHLYWGSTSQPACRTVLSKLPQVPTMATISQRPKGRDGLFLLNAAIQTLRLAKEVSSVIPAKVVFGTVNVLLTIIVVYFLLLSLGRWAPGSRLFRTPRSRSRITLSSDWPVLMCVKPSIGV
jgi:hypothetical protein